MVSNTFNGVTFTFRRVGPTGTSLRTDRYSSGLTTAGWTAKLVSDGITFSPDHIGNTVGVSTAPGTQIELTISNLSVGAHTLLTWHNTWQSAPTYSFCPLNIYLNGTQIITNMPVSNRVTNNADAAYSHVEFVAVSNQNTVILYEGSTNALGSFKFTVTDAQGASLTNTVGLRLITATAPPAQPPVLGIRKQSGALMLELTGESGRSLIIESKTNLTASWSTWTNVTGSGAMQLLPLNALTNQSSRYFRAFAQ